MGVCRQSVWFTGNCISGPGVCLLALLKRECQENNHEVLFDCDSSCSALLFLFDWLLLLCTPEGCRDRCGQVEWTVWELIQNCHLVCQLKSTSFSTWRLHLVASTYSNHQVLVGGLLFLSLRTPWNRKNGAVSCWHSLPRRPWCLRAPCPWREGLFIAWRTPLFPQSTCLVWDFYCLSWLQECDHSTDV